MAPMNLVDLLAILPFYVALILEVSSPSPSWPSLVVKELQDVEDISNAGKFVRLVRMVRCSWFSSHQGTIGTLQPID